MELVEPADAQSDGIHECLLRMYLRVILSRTCGREEVGILLADSQGSRTHELVAHSCNSEDEVRTSRVLFQLFAQTADVHIYSPSQRLVAISPDGTQEFLSRDRHPRMLNKMSQ